MCLQGKEDLSSRLMIPVEESARTEHCLLLLLMQMRCGCNLAGREPRAQRVNCHVPIIRHVFWPSSVRSLTFPWSIAAGSMPFPSWCRSVISSQWATAVGSLPNSLSWGSTTASMSDS